MNSATMAMSCSLSPLVVRAGVPSRMPPGLRALLSPGTVFLLQAMDMSSSTRSARDPLSPVGRRSTQTRWLSVPPDTQV
uniref:Putative secreted protein n=1 Tax=Ixodes ricinus TaxID=34613 RepID=A0A6B0U405_IXORI